MHTRTAHPDQVDQTPGRYDVADGGVYIRVGDQEIAVTARTKDDDDVVHESILRAQTVVTALRDSADAALRELEAMLICGGCDGAKGQAAGPDGWVDCPTCHGSGRRTAAEIAA